MLKMLYLLRQDARILKANTDFLINWTDQEATSGIVINSKKVSMVTSKGSLHEGKKGVQRNRKTSGFPWTLAQSRGSIKGTFVNFLQIALIVFMKMPSMLGSICW